MYQLPGRAALILLVAATISTTTFAQQSSAIDATSRAQVIDALEREMTAYYVFPDIARKTVQVVREKQRRGGYDAAVQANQLASALTADLQTASRDLHLNVSVNKKEAPSRQPNQSPEALHAHFKSLNYGIGAVDTLPGNIGYLEMSNFVPARYADKAISAAMTQLADTDALIIDLRGNGGGDPGTVAFLTSYLFDKRTHLNDLYWREGDRVASFWTTESVPGKKFGQKKPVYVLTSRRTFSAAEEFSYNLQQLKRAVIVGETSGGGANPGKMRVLTTEFSVFMPNGRAINPITKTNWEGVGVVPDARAPAADALLASQKMALKKLLATSKTTAQRQTLNARLVALDKQASPAAASFGKHPIYLRGSMNNWGTEHAMQRITATAFRAEIMLKQGPHEFKLASEDFSAVDLGALRGQRAVRPATSMTLADGGENLLFDAAQGGLHTFSLDVSDPYKPTLSIVGKP